MSETVTVRVGRAEISVPAEDVAQHIIASLTGQQAALATTAPPKTGEPWPGQGGIYAGMMRNPGGRDYHLIYPTAEMGGEHESVRWSEDDDADIDGADNEWDGLKNTRALVESDADCPAAEWAAGLVIEGHADYYLPSRRELALAWANIPERFDKVWHWSSTQHSSGAAFGQTFNYGDQDFNYSTNCYRARAVRRLFIN